MSTLLQSRGCTRDLQRSCLTRISLWVYQWWSKAVFHHQSNYAIFNSDPEPTGSSSDLLLQSQGNQPQRALQVAYAQQEGFPERGRVPLHPRQRSGHRNGMQAEIQLGSQVFPTRKEGGINSSPANGSAEPTQ